MRGEMVWIYAFDLAFEAKLDAAAEILAGDAAYRKGGHYRRAPGGVALYRPLVVELPERVMDCPGCAPSAIGAPGPGFTVRPCAKLFSVGAVSVTIRLPFEVADLDALLPYRLITDSEGPGPLSLARGMARELFERVKPALVKTEPRWDSFESYSAVCISDAGRIDNCTCEWLEFHRAQVAALLAGEESPEKLSEEQVAESLRLTYSYNRTDLAVVDWDALLVVDTETDYEELLYVAEAANVQLVELRSQDDVLDRVIDSAYLDVARYQRRLLGSPERIARSLREQRIDLERMADEILNSAKYFGDWHLARIYHGLRDQFHLAEWEAQLDRKLRTVDSLYSLLAREILDRRMLVLEVAIVALFVIDIVLLLLGRT